VILPKKTKENSPDSLRGFLEIAKQIVEYQNASQKIATRMVFIAGIFLAVVGVSIFEDLLHIPKEYDHPFQLGLYRFADIVITGGLLGGGSKSFHSFISATESVFDRVKEKNQ